MKMNLKQTKLVGLTMELELKTKDYKMLCEKLENLKKNNIDANNPILLTLRDEFLKNHNEIAEINKQIREIQNIEEPEEIIEQYDYKDIFKNKKRTTINNEKLDMVVVDENKNIFIRILEKINKILSK